MRVVKRTAFEQPDDQFAVDTDGKYKPTLNTIELTVKAELIGMHKLTGEGKKRNRVNPKRKLRRGGRLASKIA